MDRDYYISQDYITKGRFISYWHQINEIVKLKPASVLEVGIGNGFLTNFLKRKDLKLYTIDLSSKLLPDIAADVLKIPFIEEAFDVVACFQMLEHLPYDNFIDACKELYRVSKKYVVISLPDISRVSCFYFHVPYGKIIKKLIPLPRLFTPAHKFDGEHHWEIGFKAYPLRRITADIELVGFKVVDSYRVFEYRHHRFFILKK